MQTRTYTQLATLIKGLTGNTDFTTDEDTLINSFINRRIYGAYRKSRNWPRYAVFGELRAVSNSVIPFTQATLDSIDTFFRVYENPPYGTNGTREFEFIVNADGALVVGDSGDATSLYVDYKKRWEGDYNSTSNSNIPLEFFHYAAHGATADFLRYDHQYEKARAEDAVAEEYLAVEMESLMNQRNANLAGTRVQSHSTQQSR